MTALQTRPQTPEGVLRALEREARRDSERRTEWRADPRVTCSGEATNGRVFVTYAPAAKLRYKRLMKLAYGPGYWYWLNGSYLLRPEALKVLKETL